MLVLMIGFALFFLFLRSAEQYISVAQVEEKGQRLQIDIMAMHWSSVLS